MVHWNRMIRISFSFAMCGLLIVSFIFLSSINRLSQDVNWVSHTYHVLDLINQLRVGVRELDVSQKNIVLGYDRETTRIQTAVEALITAQSTLRTLTSDNPHQQQRLDQLSPLIGEHIASLNQLITIRDNEGVQQALAFMRNGESLESITLWQLLNEMIQEENTLLAERVYASETTTRATETAAILGLMFSIGVLITCFSLLRRSHDELEERVKTRTRDLEISNQKLQVEISVRQEAERSAHEQAERFRVTLASIGDGVITTDTAGVVTFTNAVAAQLMGVEEADAVGRPLIDVFRIINEDTRETVPSPVQRVLREGIIVGLANHTVLISQDGTERAIDDSGAPIRDTSGHIIGAVLVFHDISARKQLEIQVRNSAAQLQQIIDAVPMLIVYLDKDQRHRFANKAYAEWFGVDQQELAGKHSRDVIGDTVYNRVYSAIEQALRGESVSFETNMNTHHGAELRDVFVTYLADLDAEGHSQGAIGVIIEITERKRAERAIRDSEARFRTIADTAPVLIWITDLEKGRTFFNQRWLEFTGRSVEEEQGQGWLVNIHPDDLERYQQTFKKASEAQQGFQMEYRLRRADGEYCWILHTSMPRLQPDSTFIGYIGTGVDITQRKEAEEGLRKATLYQTAIAELGHFALTQTELQPVLDKALQLASEALDMEYGGIREYLPEHNALIARSELGWQLGTTPLLLTLEPSAERFQSLASYTYLNGSPVVVPDLKSETRFFVPPAVHVLEVQSALSVRIYGRMPPFGVLELHTKHNRVFALEEIYFLQTVTNTLGTAIERFSTERALQDSEERLRFALQAAKMAVFDWRLTASPQISYINLHQAFDIDLDGIDGEIDLSALIDPDDLPGYTAILHNALETCSTYTAQFRMQGPEDSSERWIEIRGQVVCDVDGVFTRRIGLISDISVLKQSEILQSRLADQLRVELRRQQALSTLALAVNSQASRNDVLQIAVGQLRAELGGTSATLFLLQNDKRFAQCVAAQSIEGTDINGQIIALDVLPHTQEALQTGKVVYFTLEQVADAEEPYFLSMGFTSTLIIPLVAMGEILGTAYVNYTLPRTPPDDEERRFASDMATQCTLAIYKASLLSQRDQLLREVQHRAETLEDRVQERTRELEDANRHKTQFLSHMSHELRTPLNSILGYTDIVLQELPGPLNEEQHKQLSLVKESARQLLKLISGLLDIARIEAGKVEVKVSEFSLQQLLYTITESVRPLAENKGLRLSLEIAPSLNEKLMRSDELKVKQILFNLLSNAIKFTDDGQITLTAQVRGGVYADDAIAVITVQDTGIGISEMQLPHLFTEFGQLPEAGARAQGGTGLGLVLTQRLVQLLHGEIRVDSTLGQGSTFKVMLPLSTLARGSVS
jgi:PAS domain S-box-containing protein